MDEQNHENNASSPWKVLFFLVPLMFVFITVIFLVTVFCDAFWPYRLTVPSPTGDYALEQRYMDWGPSYRCHTYLLANNRYYKISNIGPGGALWDNEETFSVGFRADKWYGETYTVSDFTGEQAEKGADPNAGP